MTKYGFDYFVKRAEILEEMGRPSPWASLGDSGNLMVDLFRSVNTLMARGGDLSTQDLKTGETVKKHVPGLGSNRSTNRALRYMIYMMSKMDEADSGSGEDEIGEEEAKSEIIDQATSILGIPKEGWSRVKDAQGNTMFKDPDKLYRAAIQKGIQKFSDYISTPEFKQKTSNPENIISYVQGNRLPTAASAAKAAKRGEQQGGMSAEEMDRIETSDKDVRIAINKAMGHDKVRKRSLYDPEDELPEQEEPVNLVSNTNIDDVFTVTDALENIRDFATSVKDRVNSAVGDTRRYKDQKAIDDAVTRALDDLEVEFSDYPEGYAESLYNVNLPVIDSLLARYTSLQDVGIDMDKFRSGMAKLQSSLPENSKQTIDALLAEVDALQETTEEVSTKGNYGLQTKTQKKTKEKQNFPGYHNAVTDKFLDTPEKREMFKTWNNYRYNQLLARQEKVQDIKSAEQWGIGETPGEQEKVRRGFQAFLDKRPHLQPKDKKEKPPTPAQRKEMDDVPDDWVPDDEEPEEDEESYIMGYMTEQINKDKFKPKGEFKDRGFKKMSYHQWISKYQ